MTAPRRWCAAATLLLAACTAAPPANDAARTDASAPSSSGTGSESPSTATQAASSPADDIDELVDAIEDVHPDPFGAIDERRWRQAVAAAKGRADQMTPNELLVTVGQLSNLGHRNGHGGVFPTDQPDLAAWPLRLYQFDDGWRVVDSTEESLVGAKVERIAGRAVDEVADALAPMVPRDNAASLRARLGAYLVVPAFLSGIGIQHPDSLTIVDARGRRRTVPAPDTVGVDAFIALTGLVVPQIPPALPRPEVAPAEDYFWSHAVEGALLVGYERVLASSPTGPTLDEFNDAMRRRIARRAPSALIVDLRRNPGGEKAHGDQMVGFFREVARQGIPVRVLVSRSTYSAASLLVAQLRRVVHVTLYGETTGGGSDGFGDPTHRTLSHSGIVVQLATRSFSLGGPLVAALRPDVPVVMSWAAFARGDDPVLDAALRASRTSRRGGQALRPKPGTG